MKVIIYGLGTKSRLVSSKLKSTHKIVEFTDLNSNIQSFDNVKFFKLKELTYVYFHWKVEFEEFIYYLQDKYDFKYLNFKECKEISSNDEYYQDIAHLNYGGATAFTTILDGYID